MDYFIIPLVFYSYLKKSVSAKAPVSVRLGQDFSIYGLCFVVDFNTGFHKLWFAK
jgi:hypothetical protein